MVRSFNRAKLSAYRRYGDKRNITGQTRKKTRTAGGHGKINGAAEKEPKTKAGSSKGRPLCQERRYFGGAMTDTWMGKLRRKILRGRERQRASEDRCVKSGGT